MNKTIFFFIGLIAMVLSFSCAIVAPETAEISVESNNIDYGTVTGAGIYEVGESITIKAIPTDGFYWFLQWDDGYTEATRNIIVPSEGASYKAEFIEIGKVLIEPSVWEAGTVTVTGPVLLSAREKICKVGTTITITAIPASSYKFDYWSDYNTESSREIVVSSGRSIYRAVFEKIYLQTIIVQANNDTFGTVTGSGTYDAGETVIITATPASGYRFDQWNDGNTDATREITVPSSGATYTATFIELSTIQVVSIDTNQGTVTGSGTYDAGETVIITATPASGYRFDQWNDGNTDATREITVLSGGATYTAKFVKQKAVITVQSNNEVYGTVTGGGTYEVGDIITITAIPASGYRFDQWNDGNTETTRDIIVVSGGSTFTASFVEVATITVLHDTDSVNITVSGSGTYDVGEVITITTKFIDGCGYRFSGWNDGNTETTREVTVLSGGATYTALFIKQGYICLKAQHYDTHKTGYGTVSGEGKYDFGDTVTISATPNEGFGFVKWSDWNRESIRDVMVPEYSKTYTAYFHEISNISLSSNKDIYGTTSGGGTYFVGDTVTISAIPNEGYGFYTGVIIIIG